MGLALHGLDLDWSGAGEFGCQYLEILSASIGAAGATTWHFPRSEFGALL